MTVDVSQSGAVRTLCVSRAPANAWDLGVVRDLASALLDGDADDGTQVLVISAPGEVFCSGGEIGGPEEGQTIEAHRQDYVDAFVRLDDTLRTIGTPVIARVQGPANAGGLAVVAACDVAVAVDDATVATPEVRGGMFPLLAMGMLWQHLPPKRAFSMFYSGTGLTAREAVDVGLLTEAVPAAELDSRVALWCDRLVAASPKAVALGRRAYWAMAADAANRTAIGGEALLALIGGSAEVPSQDYMYRALGGGQ